MDFAKCCICLMMVLVLAMIQAGHCIGEMTTEQIKTAVAKAFYEDLKQLQREGSMDKRGSRISRTKDFGYLSRPKYHKRLLYSQMLAKKVFRNNDVETKLMIRSAMNNGRKLWNRYNLPFTYSRRAPVIDMVIPTMTRKLRLINMLDQALTVVGNNVAGSNRIFAPEARLQLESVGFGSVMIKSLEANRYICMDKSTGDVTARMKKSLECVFIERMEPNYHTTYQAFLHRKSKRKWYLAINANGKVVNGRKGRLDRKKSQFKRI